MSPDSTNGSQHRGIASMRHSQLRISVSLTQPRPDRRPRDFRKCLRRIGARTGDRSLEHWRPHSHPALTRLWHGAPREAENMKTLLHNPWHSSLAPMHYVDPLPGSHVLDGSLYPEITCYTLRHSFVSVVAKVEFASKSMPARQAKSFESTSRARHQSYGHAYGICYTDAIRPYVVVMRNIDTEIWG